MKPAFRMPKLDIDSWLIAAALVLLIVACFMPGVSRLHDTYEYVIVFDITQSMDVEDYELDGAPVSRLQYARNAVRHAIRELPCGSRIGWGAFAEYRTLLLLSPVEVCANYNDLLTSLDAIDGRMRWANASEVTKGVYWAIRAAKEVDSTPDLVFISDGQEAPPIRPDRPPVIPDDVKSGQVHGFLIGVGGDTPRPIPKTDDDGARIGYWRADEVVQPDPATAKGAPMPGNEHLSALRERHLQALAGLFGFTYTRLTTPETIATAIRDPRLARRKPGTIDLYWLPVAAAVALLVWIFRTVPSRRR